MLIGHIISLISSLASSITDTVYIIHGMWNLLAFMSIATIIIDHQMYRGHNSAPVHRIDLELAPGKRAIFTRPSSTPSIIDHQMYRGHNSAPVHRMDLELAPGERAIFTCPI